MLINFRNLRCMSIKIQYWHSHLDSFPEYLSDLIKEQGERFRQSITVMEDRYQGRWNMHMMADYCWNLQRDWRNKIHSRSLLYYFSFQLWFHFIMLKKAYFSRYSVIINVFIFYTCPWNIEEINRLCILKIFVLLCESHTTRMPLLILEIGTYVQLFGVEGLFSLLI